MIDEWSRKRLLIEGTDANANLVVTAKAILIIFLGWVKPNFSSRRLTKLCNSKLSIIIDIVDALQSQQHICGYIVFYFLVKEWLHIYFLVDGILDVLFPAIFCSKLQVLQFARLALFELMETSSQKCQSQDLHMKTWNFIYGMFEKIKRCINTSLSNFSCIFLNPNIFFQLEF